MYHIRKFLVLMWIKEFPNMAYEAKIMQNLISITAVGEEKWFKFVTLTTADSSTTN